MFDELVYSNEQKMGRKMCRPVALVRVTGRVLV